MRVVLIILTGVIIAGAAWGDDDKIFISEVLHESATGSPPPFIELYNAGKSNVGLEDWRIRIATKKGSETVTLPSEAIIPDRGFYLIGREQDRSAWSKFSYRPDYYCSLSMDYVSGKGGVILIRSNGECRDTVGWGRVPWPFYEGTPHFVAGEGRSLERKSAATHSEVNGNSYDTDDNSNDLRERSKPQPQNINSPREYPAATTEGNAWGRIKAMYHGQ